MKKINKKLLMLYRTLIFNAGIMPVVIMFVGYYFWTGKNIIFSFCFFAFLWMLISGKIIVKKIKSEFKKE